MKKTKKIIVVGANHAGTSFLRTIRKLKPEYEVVAYDRNTNTSYLGCGTALWVGGEFHDANGLFYSNPQLLREMGVKLHLEHELVELKSKEKKVIIRDNNSKKEFEDSYDILVFGGGTWPIVPPLPGVNLEGIMLAKVFQHAQKIYEKANSAKVQNVVVVGAGYIGVELVEAFHLKGKKVTLIDMASRVIDKYFDEEFTDEMENRMRKAGVKLQFGEKLIEFKSKDGKNVSSVVTDKGEYPAEMVILSIGFKPLTNIKGFELFDKYQNGSIKVDQFQRSLNDENIYIIGDAASLHHNASKDFRHVALATNAVKTGLVAALDAAGIPVPFPGVQGTNAISVFGCHYASTGYSMSAAKTLLKEFEFKSEFILDNDRPEFMKTHSKVAFKIVYDPKTLRLVGAQVGSWDKTIHTEIIYAMSLAIQKQMTLPEIALMDVYFLPHFNKPFNFMLVPILKALGIDYSKK
ncbi:FAD-dependent oxidoreductase [[Mycoplasma] mobile]|uniref:NADH oxidase n=1 Tax=Mycoplasma mobile (strain ATCC 43663 / 163K / NCTC 11711) TaxID=267748 RepID=Q6KH25_MYCM1|nr:FAD-dependent oxidoreductase [[Mycoplasma] mobile]AAT28106.1 NADH oxidase [Mycoplasma mobile 163K]